MLRWYRRNKQLLWSLPILFLCGWFTLMFLMMFYINHRAEIERFYQTKEIGNLWQIVPPMFLFIGLLIAIGCVMMALLIRTIFPNRKAIDVLLMKEEREQLRRLWK